MLHCMLSNLFQTTRFIYAQLLTHSKKDQTTHIISRSQMLTYATNVFFFFMNIRLFIHIIKNHTKINCIKSLGKRDVTHGTTVRELKLWLMYIYKFLPIGKSLYFYSLCSSFLVIFFTRLRRNKQQTKPLLKKFRRKRFYSILFACSSVIGSYEHIFYKLVFICLRFIQRFWKDRLTHLK